jgi:hypothetical protein
MGIMPLTSIQAGMSTQSAVGSGQSTVASGSISPQAGVESALVIQGAGRGNERALTPRIGQEAVDLFSPPNGTQTSTEQAVVRSADSERPLGARGVYRGDKPFAASNIDASQLAVDSVLDELVSKGSARDEARGMTMHGVDLGDWTALLAEYALAPSAAQPEQHGEGFHSASDSPTDTATVPLRDSRRGVFSSLVQPTDLLLKAGVFGIGASVLTAKTLSAGRMDGKRRLFGFRRKFSR